MVSEFHLFTKILLLITAAGLFLFISCFQFFRCRFHYFLEYSIIIPFNRDSDSEKTYKDIIGWLDQFGLGYLLLSEPRWNGGRKNLDPATGFHFFFLGFFSFIFLIEFFFQIQHSLSPFVIPGQGAFTRFFLYFIFFDWGFGIFFLLVYLSSHFVSFPFLSPFQGVIIGSSSFTPETAEKAIQEVNTSPFFFLLWNFFHPLFFIFSGNL